MFKLTAIAKLIRCYMAEIPINDLTPRNQYTATAAQATFDYDFPIFDQTHLVVEQTLASDGSTSTLLLTTDYTVSGVGDATGGAITIVTPANINANDIITIERDVPIARSSDYITGGDFKAVTVNKDIDLIIMMLQELELDLQRSVALASEDTTASLTLPIASARANGLFAFDANGDILISGGSSGDVAVSAAMVPVVQALTLALARTAFGLGAADNVQFSQATIAGLINSGLVTESGIISPTSLAANANNYAPTGIGTASLVRLSASTPVNITGISASQTNGRTITFINNSANAITLVHGSGSSDSENRLNLPSGADITLQQHQAVTLFYDLTSTKWRLKGGAGGGAGGESDAGNNVIGFANKNISAGDYTLAADENMLTAGPFTIDTGHTFTINGTWTIP